jgi:uncharacterized protein
MRQITSSGSTFRAMALGLIAGIVFLHGCAQQSTPVAGSEDPVLQSRRERDAALRHSQQSPIPERDRAGFQGLEYFAVNPELRLRVKLNRYPVPERVRLGTNTGEMRDGLKYGFFEFHAEGQDCRLQVYRLDENGADGKPYLFVPFKDATSGLETYGAGRYIDLSENTSGFYDLDFNRAYNPSCAYGSEFSCPIAPEENRLSIPIRAGEKTYKHASGH